MLKGVFSMPPISSVVNHNPQPVANGTAVTSSAGVQQSPSMPMRAALAGPLAGMAAYKQFILYRVVPSVSRPGKTDKLPTDLAGLTVSAHDPKYWMDAADGSKHRGNVRRRLGCWLRIH